MLLALAVGAFCLAGCAGETADDLQTARAAEEEQTDGLAWSGAAAVEVTGRVILAHEYDLSFPQSGLLAELAVEEGDQVAAGDVLARLDTTELEAQLERAQADLAVAEADRDIVLAGPHPAQIAEAEQNVIAAGTTPAVTLQQIEANAAEKAAAQARLDYLLAQPFPEDVARAEAGVARAETAVQAIEALFEQAVILAPVSGTVIDVAADTGETLYAGQVIIRVADTRQLRVEVEVDEIDIAGINPGGSAAMTFDALPGLEIAGTVVHIRPSETSRTPAFTLLIDLAEIPEDLRWGMSVNVAFSEE
jgi:RND family efflux transporter MFP subunit